MAHRLGYRFRLHRKDLPGPLHLSFRGSKRQCLSTAAFGTKAKTAQKPLYFGPKRFGSRLRKQKIALILDHGGYRYRAALSDISGRDIAVHKGGAPIAISQVRDWLDTCRQAQNSLPGGDDIVKQYQTSSRQLSARSSNLKLNANELTYVDICRAIEA